MAFDKKEFEDLVDKINMKTARNLDKMLDDEDSPQNPTVAAAINFLKLHRRIVEPPMPQPKEDSATKILIEDDED